MDKESVILKQEVDCNCNDCAFFVRDIDALNDSKKEHRRWEALSVRSKRQYFWDEAQKALEKGKLDSHRDLLRERSRVSIDKSYRSGLVFGSCSKFGKTVQVVPNVCQIETQSCFRHRRRS